MNETQLEKYDPDDFRMTLGDHLEELRRRLIYGILGFALALVLCLIFGKQMLSIFCKPMFDVMLEYDINPSFFVANISDPFMVYMQISMISATVIASPWIVWQFWQFVAAGLYPHERKTVTRYIPLSLTLLIGGMSFVYFLVLPWTLQFFMSFSISIPLPTAESAQIPTTNPAALNMPVLPPIPGDPIGAPSGSMWFDTIQNRPKIMVNGVVRVLQFGAENLVSPMLLLPEYVDMAMGMLVVFGLSFQLPIMIMVLAKVGIIRVESLRGMRRIVYFCMGILAAIITPGDVITATIALMIPLCALFELGIFLAARTPKLDGSDFQG